jgi:hypothetical protein
MNDPPTGERDVLIDVAGWAQEVAGFVESSTEAMSLIEVLEPAHRSIASFYAPVILFDHVVFILTGAVINLHAEFLGDGPGIAGMAVGGDLLGLDLGDRSGGAEERLGGGHVAGFAEIDVDQITVPVNRPVQITPVTSDLEVGSTPMEGRPEISISSKNQQFEAPQVVAQAWTPIHSLQGQHGLSSCLDGRVAGDLQVADHLDPAGGRLGQAGGLAAKYGAGGALCVEMIGLAMLAPQPALGAADLVNSVAIVAKGAGETGAVRAGVLSGLAPAHQM